LNARAEGDRLKTIADLEGAQAVRRVHVTEALIYRRVAPGSVIGSAALTN
jgi:magnesium chelatase family protein